MTTDPQAIATRRTAGPRPPIHLLASESDLVAGLALRTEDRQPVVAAMLLEEIERAELHDADTMPAGHVMLNSHVAFVDEKTQQMGAALYGLAAGHMIEWPDLHGRFRPIRIVRVAPPGGD